MNRRAFLRAGATGAGALALGPAFLERAFAAPIAVGAGPYGPISTTFDGNGIALPSGFSSRKIAQGGENVAGSTPAYAWHTTTDGQATFRTLTGGAPDGGWILVSNSELPVIGGVSGIEFAADGSVQTAYRVLNGTSLNCAGGPTPWGTWLSCEENPIGMVHECDPTQLNVGVAKPAMGLFSHEAACVDPVNRRLYLTEDQPDGCLYRFTPTAYPDLSAGLLEVAVGSAPGVVGWAEVPNPAGGALQPTRTQVGQAVHFNGGEGLWFDEGVVYFTTKGDGRVWTLTTATNAIEILYDPATVPGGPLSGVDNITVSPSGDVFVCEDGRDHDICIITPELEVTRFLKLDSAVHGAGATNETVGVIFNPDGNRMYFGAQRSFGVGVVYEITGPFRQTAGRKKIATVKLIAPRRRSIRKFLKRGLPFRLEIDGPVGIDATLTMKAPGKKGKDAGKSRKKKRKGTRTLGRLTPSVALDSVVDLRMKPTKRAARLLRGRSQVTAQLTVVAKDSAGTETTVAQKVKLVGGRKRGRGKGGGKR